MKKGDQDGRGGESGKGNRTKVTFIYIVLRICCSAPSLRRGTQSALCEGGEAGEGGKKATTTKTLRLHYLAMYSPRLNWPVKSFLTVYCVL